MSTFTSFAIAGAGNIGVFIAEELLSLKASGKVKDVVLLTRSSNMSTKNESIEKLVSQGARVAAVDYSSQDTLKSILTGIDVVISTVSVIALDFQASLAQAAKAAGVRLFLPSEFGNPTDKAKSGVLLAKRQVHTMLKELDLPYLLAFTGLFSDWIFNPLLGFDLENGKASYGADGNALITFTSRHDIVHFLVHILTTLPAEKLYWTTFRIEGDRISFNEIIRQYQEKTGKKVDVTLRSAEELEAALKMNAHDFVSELHLEWARGDGVVGKPEEVSNGMWPGWNPKKVIDFIAP